MTTGIVLGTAHSQREVIEAVRKAGFNDNKVLFYIHDNIRSFDVQVSTPGYFYKVPGVVTELEFRDHSNRFPQHRQALKVLTELYQCLPDLICRQASYPSRTPIKNLSDYLKQYI